MIGWVLLALALGLLLLAWQLRRRTGLPWQRIVYNDSGWERPDRPLVAREHGLVGKPDYVLRVRGAVVPVEVKPSRRARTPYESDLMQLAAYCLLVEATTGQAPPYGLLCYADQTFKLPYDAAVRRDVADLVAAIRRDRDHADVSRSHRQAARCGSCGFVDICGDSLA